MPSQFLDAAVAAARAAGAIIKEQYQTAQPGEYERKSDRSLVTKTDLAAEQAIFDVIKTTYPDHAIFSEESGAGGGSSDYTWVIDPVDGTTNFAHRLGAFCTSIALRHSSEVVVGVVYDPIRDELFASERGQGACLNNQPIKASQQTTLSDAVLVLAHTREAAARTAAGKTFAAASEQAGTVRILGSIALHVCYVACGRFDGSIGHSPKFHDCAAATLIAQEAGATATNFKNQPWQPATDDVDDLIVANPQLHQSLLELVNSS